MSDVETGGSGPEDGTKAEDADAQEVADRMGADDADESGAGYGNHATGYEEDVPAGMGSDQR